MKEQVNVRLDTKTIERLDDLRPIGISRSAYIERLIASVNPNTKTIDQTQDIIETVSLSKQEILAAVADIKRRLVLLA